MQTTPNNFVPIVTKIATDIARQVVQDALIKDQYSVPTVADHHHNGTDATQIDANDIVNAGLPTNGDGVASPKNLAGAPAGNNNKINRNLVPGFVMIGQGANAFNGGDAPIGTIMAFANGANLSQQLYIRLDVDGYTNRWWGVNLNITAL